MPSLSQATLVDSTALDAGSMMLTNIAINSSNGNDVVDGMMEAIKTANMPKCNELRNEISIIGDTMHASVTLKSSLSTLVDGFTEEKEFYEETLKELQENNGNPQEIANYTADIERRQQNISDNQGYIAAETVEIEAYAAKIASLRAQLEELDGRTSAAYKFIIYGGEMYAIYSNSYDFDSFDGVVVKDVGTEDVAMTSDLYWLIADTAVDCMPHAAPAA
ncbi:hypothetical protein IW148_001861 [Coemansia sp. RSA 1199]|nr:hypothetical protein IW148_001861 [Coemansia sp. RSA 1199]